MNRTIKFRGQRKSDKQWVYGSLLELRNSEGIETWGIKDTCYNVNNGRIDLIPHEVIPETVGQYTGLLDRNNKEIFEGDVLNGEFATGLGLKSTKYKSFNFSISFHGHDACFHSDMPENYGKYRFLPHVSNCIIVGNIHDNPSLILKD